jgi:hypothetical protein
MCPESQSFSQVKAKETKKCHHRQLMSADAVEFCQLWRMRTLLCYVLSADSSAPAVGADWAVTKIVLICDFILEDASLFHLYSHPTGKLIFTWSQVNPNDPIWYHFVLKYFFVNNLMTIRYQRFDANQKLNDWYQFLKTIIDTNQNCPTGNLRDLLICNTVGP